MRPRLIAECATIFAGTLIVYLALHSDRPATSAPRLPDPSADRERLVKAGGGNAQSEAAVARALEWLAKQQKEDGHWEFDGSSKEKAAATGMALLPFLAAGETQKDGKKYQKAVAAGVDWLMGEVRPDGSLGTINMYAHAIATIALCEAAGRPKDPKAKTKATEAATFLLKCQGANGSWGYTPRTDGDTSIVGWQVQALAAAKFAELKLTGTDANAAKALEAADQFLDSVSTDDGSKYGYREKGASQTLTPVGLLSRHSIGTLPADGKVMDRGAEFLKGFPPQKTYFDMYYYFYATRVMFARGGPDWHKFWNPRMRDLLIDLQTKDGEAKGSWEKDQGFIGQACGRLGTTALAALTLEVYYRYPPPKWMEK